MAATDETYSPRLEEFTRRQKEAKANAKDLKAEFVESMVSSVQTQQESVADPEDVADVEFDLVNATRQILQAPRVREREAAEQRAKSRQERAKELAGDQAERKPSGAAASLADMSPAAFKKSLASAFSELDVDQAHWLKELAESAENAAWERESKGEADSYLKDPEKTFSDHLSDLESKPARQRVKTRDEFEDDLSYDNYIAYLANVDGGGGGDADYE